MAGSHSFLPGGIPMRPSKLAAAVLLFTCLSSGFALAQESKAQPVHQLRIYEIFEPTKQAFHERFRDHAVGIMAKYDFRIVAMWEAKGAQRTEFVTCCSGQM